jgi:hypothetical protein
MASGWPDPAYTARMALGVRLPLLASAMLTVAGCGMQVESTFEAVSRPPDPAGTGEASLPSSASPSFDVALVQANFAARCRDLIEVDAVFCDRVRIDDITASGRRLRVPTTLHAGAFARASDICHQVAIAYHAYDTGADLGYRDIEVLDQSDDYLSDCRFIYS